MAYRKTAWAGTLRGQIGIIKTLNYLLFGLKAGKLGLRIIQFFTPYALFYIFIFPIVCFIYCCVIDYCPM